MRLNCRMKKTFARIRDELQQSFQSSNFDESHGVVKKFDVVHLDACRRFLSTLDNDGRSLVLTTHGFVKKTSKVPLQEISRAERIRLNYINQKL